MTATANRRESAQSHPHAQRLSVDTHAPEVLIDWGEVIAGIQDRNADITFYELSDLLHACLIKLQRSINIEIYQTINRRAKNRETSTMSVDLRV